jgi:hypothetical protein
MAFDSLGIEDGPSDHYEPDLDPAISVQDRMAKLRGTLEEFVVQMAAESTELGCPETTDTLRMQSIGILIALREVQRHFPELS